MPPSFLRLAALSLPIALAACGGGGGTSPTDSAQGASSPASAAGGTAVTSTVPAPGTTQPASLVVGAVAPSLAADGTTAIVVTLKRSDGTTFDDRPLAVGFSSTCASAGKASLDATVASSFGVAAATYQPRGCTGPDVVTARVAAGATTLASTMTVQVASTPALSAKAAVGKSLFFDAALSASGKQSCASCHSPANAYRLPGTAAVPSGGLSGTVIGFRSSPSAAYAALTPPFGFLPLTNKDGTSNNGANGKLGTPRRGLMWDGRASTVFDQAKGPFLGPHEMANASTAAVLARLLTRPYLASFAAVYGPVSATSNPDTVLTDMADAIGQFETEDASFAPFNSKFDAVQAGKASFTVQEANGQALFFDSNKAACHGCHSSTSNLHSVQGPQMFTDLSYRVIGVPRNWRLPYNVDATAAGALSSIGLSSLLNGAGRGAPGHAYYDLGFCGPFRTDSLAETTLCGAFRVPSLRNVALKGSYFHNGVFGALPQVIDFYMNRDIAPQRLYVKADGTPDIAYNDLPVAYRANLEVRPPFVPVKTGPRLSPAEVQDLVTFLCTLTDGYDPARPTSYRQPAQCRAAVRP